MDSTGTIKVTVVEMGKSQITMRVPEKCTLSTLREIADINPNLELRIKGEEVPDTHELEENDVVVATEDVKGGIA